ncbi:MAG: TRL-like family protein [Spirochaetota bacterium]
MNFQIRNYFSIISFCFFLFLLQNCTAWNYWAHYNPYINTNPTPEYSYTYSLLLKGGLVYHQNSYPAGIGNGVTSKYSGKACSYSYLYLASVGDSSINAALEDGGIQKIANVSYEQFALFSFVYHRFCTTVTGE